MKEKRISYLDIMKAFGIVFVLIYHVYSHQFVKGWLNIFQLPIFLFVAGVLFRDVSICSFLKKRQKSIIIPYFKWGGITLGYYFLIERHFRSLDLSVFDCVWKGIFLGERQYLEFNSPLWFLPCFFLTQLIFLLIYKLAYRITRKKNYSACICAVISFFLFILMKTNSIGVEIWSIGTIPKFLMYYSIGAFWQTYQNVSIKTPTLLFISLLSYVLSAFFYSFLFNDLFVCLFGVAGTLCLSASISKSTVLEYIGKKTLTIMAIHGPVYRMIAYLTGILLRESSDTIRTRFFSAAFIMIITLIICLGVDVVIMRIRKIGSTRC